MLIFISIFAFMHIGILLVCLHVCITWYLQMLEEGIGSPGSRVTDVCEPPFGFWESKPGLLKREPVCLTTELSFLPCLCLFKDSISCNPGYPETHYVAGNAFELILLPLRPKCYSVCNYTWLREGLSGKDREVVEPRESGVQA